MVLYIHGGAWTHGEKDGTVPFSNAERLDTALPEGKNRGFFIFLHSGHGLDAPEDNSIRNAFPPENHGTFSRN